jgi:hypothetical protein
METNVRIKSVTALPHNQEHFRTISFNSYILLDSLAFLGAPLGTLVDTLPKDYPFPILDQMALYDASTAKGRELKKLLVRKGIYPYEAATSLEWLINTKELPPREAFYSSLTNSTVSPEDYAHAKRVFTAFECENMLHYTEIYCGADAALLAEVFDCFRNVVYTKFRLDPILYISSPQLALDMLLLLTGVQIELLSDINHILFIESNIRGGMSFIAQRYCKAGERLNEVTGEKKFAEILYIDANNLYGWAQSQAMPLNDFQWVSPEEISALDWHSMTEDQEYGYIAEVDLIYPPSLHEEHNSFPLCPERLTITKADLSPYAKGKEKYSPLLGDPPNFFFHRPQCARTSYTQRMKI